MQSPSLNSSHVSRKLEIPGSLVLNWQSSAVSGEKPLIRRPKTACERCRTAKVKCPGDGQHDCGRCNSRGLSCRYTQQTSASPAAASACSRRRPGPVPATPEEVRMDLNADAGDQFGGDDAAIQQLLEPSVSWSNMDWSAVDPNVDWTSGASLSAGINLSEALPSASTTTSSTSATTAAGSTPVSQQEHSLSSLGLFPLITSATAADLSWQDQLASQSCQCRTGLAELIPDARAALQEGRLDAVCQVTSEVIRRCSNIVSCTSCSANCTDLICIVAIFQEVDPCFEFMAQGDIDKPIKVTMGSYEMAVDEQDAKQWRRMLVMQLVKRANGLLDSISARCQDMLKDLDPGCRLGRVNIGYLQAVIGNSRHNFQGIMRGFRDEARTTV